MVDRAGQDAPELSLGHRAELVKRLHGDLVLRGVLLHREVADLRAVPVHDRHLLAGVHETLEGDGHPGSVDGDLLPRAPLALGGQGVASDGDDDPGRRHA